MNLARATLNETDPCKVCHSTIFKPKVTKQRGCDVLIRDTTGNWNPCSYLRKAEVIYCDRCEIIRRYKYTDEVCPQAYKHRNVQPCTT
jgi:hypothetical protein